MRTRNKIITGTTAFILGGLSPLIMLMSGPNDPKPLAILQQEVKEHGRCNVSTPFTEITIDASLARIENDRLILQNDDIPDSFERQAPVLVHLNERRITATRVTLKYITSPKERPH